MCHELDACFRLSCSSSAAAAAAAAATRAAESGAAMLAAAAAAGSHTDTIAQSEWREEGRQGTSEYECGG